MNRVRLVNKLIREFGYRRYLEIGCGRGRTFRRVAAPFKVGVDPHRGGTLRMTSDAFFEVNRQTFDIVFVDGLHHREQVLADVANSCRWLARGGCVVIHDCLPTRRAHQERRPERRRAAWTGDVWKAIVDLRCEPCRDLVVVDADWGLGVLFVRPNTARLVEAPSLDWETYVSRRDELLRVVTPRELEGFVRGSNDPRTEPS